MDERQIYKTLTFRRFIVDVVLLNEAADLCDALYFNWFVQGDLLLNQNSKVFYILIKLGDVFQGYFLDPLHSWLECFGDLLVPCLIDVKLFYPPHTLTDLQ